MKSMEVTNVNNCFWNELKLPLLKVINNFRAHKLGADEDKTFGSLLKKHNVSLQSSEQRIKSLEDEVERLRRANAQLTELHSDLGSATILQSKAEIHEQVLFWMDTKNRNDDLSTEQMKEKLGVQALKIKDLTSKNVALENKLAGAKVSSSFFNKLALYQKAIKDAQANEKTEDLIEHILNAFEKGHVDVTLLLYQFCIVQFKFLAMDTFPSCLGQVLYQNSDVVKKFSLNFFNNSKAVYALLRGYSECDLFRDRTDVEESEGMDVH